MTVVQVYLSSTHPWLWASSVQWVSRDGPVHEQPEKKQQHVMYTILLMKTEWTYSYQVTPLDQLSQIAPLQHILWTDTVQSTSSDDLLALNAFVAKSYALYSDSYQENNSDYGTSSLVCKQITDQSWKEQNLLRWRKYFRPWRVDGLSSIFPERSQSTEISKTLNQSTNCSMFMNMTECTVIV